MKEILYFTNMEVPYRAVFFNELAKECKLTVLYESSSSKDRDEKWAKSECNLYKAVYLDRNHISAAQYCFQNYDEIILGCVNSPLQLWVSVVMRLLHRPYFLNLDGEMFFHQKGIKNIPKNWLKVFFTKGAKQYLTAGEMSSQSLKNVLKDASVVPYYFSSLTDNEIVENAQMSSLLHRNGTVLVVGRYYDYKGMDIALKAAKMDQTIMYTFVGMGERTEQFIQEQDAKNIPNVRIIPFLQKEQLWKEYQRAALLVLPSRQECWGLVVNEAASFGIPIVSTTGSGAAVEFLQGDYTQQLAIAGDAEDLYRKIKETLGKDNANYSKYLLEKSKHYSIQKMVEAHKKALKL